MDVTSPPLGPVEASILSELSPTFAVNHRSVADVTLRCLESGSAGSQSTPPVVFIHGRGMAATIWFPILPEFALAQRGPVIAIDLPGFGGSSSTPFRGGPEEGLRFFVDPIEELLLQQGLEGATIVGHSLGGFVAAEIALRGKVKPGRLVLIGGMGLGPLMTFGSRLFFRAGPERLIRAGGPRLLRLIDPSPNTPTGQKLAALAHELYAVPGGRPNPTAAFNALYPMAGAAFNRLDKLNLITCPTLLIWGENDAVFPPSVARDAAAKLPNATLCVEALGHAPHLQDPSRILPVLTRFLYPSRSAGPTAT